MQLSQRTVARYRLYRLLITVGVGVSMLMLALAVRVYISKHEIAEHQQTLATDTVGRIERLLDPVAASTAAILPLVDQNCSDIQKNLRQSVAQRQTLRSIALVRNDDIFCSSLMGARHRPFAELLPELAHGKSTLLLKTSTTVTKGLPTLIFWVPAADQNRSGILYVFNIQLLAQFLLEPQLPYAEQLVLSTGDTYLEYGREALIGSHQLQGERQYQATSTKYPFAITLIGPSPLSLALQKLPEYIPTLLLFSLLVAFVCYLATGNRVSLGYHINLAITRKEFLVYCQPIINSQSGKCIGVEMLMRWRNRRQGWISPDVFIPLAEQNNQIMTLTRYLLTNVVENLPLFPSCPSFYISINVDAQHFCDTRIVQDIATIWQPANPRPTLMLELTERSPLSEVQYEYIAALQQQGILLAIDDFGTGHSSLSYLKHLNPSVLKIDRGFTASIGTEAINATVTETIITLAQRLNLKLVAEGVENKQQADYLRARGVNAMQGYYFAHPMPIGSFPIWLKRYEEKRLLAADMNKHQAE